MFFHASRALSFVSDPWFWAAILLAAGAVLWRRSWRVAAALAALAATVPLLFAVPRVANALQDLAESSAYDSSRPGLVYDAAIVLGGEDQRIAAAGDIARQGRARYVLYSGFLNAGDETHVRKAMAAAGVPEARLVLEKRSRNTRENALESSRVVAERGWRTLLLITSAAHVARAAGCFRAAGLHPDVLPADRLARHFPQGGWLPTRAALEQSKRAMHEFVGRLVYRALGYSR